MQGLLCVIDASGSMGAGGMAERAEECLRVLYEEGVLKSEDVFLWGEEVCHLPPSPVRGQAGGRCSFAALAGFLSSHTKEAVLIISDGYAFKDAEPSELLALKRLRGDFYFVQLLPGRRMTVVGKVFGKEKIFFAEELYLLVEGLRAGKSRRLLHIGELGV